MLVHEPKRMQEFMHGHNQPVAKAPRVQVHHLLSASHAQLTLALGARVDCHVVGTGAVGRHKGDTGTQLGDIVHRLSGQDPQLTEK